MPVSRTASSRLQKSDTPGTGSTSGKEYCQVKFLHTLRNYLCYCGIEKDEYKELKKDAYVSNFRIWRVLHILMALVFAFLWISSLSVDILLAKRFFYLAAFLYGLIASCLFWFILKKDSIVAQFLIYLSISLLYVLGGLITQANPDIPATTFIVFLILTPLFMLDKPYFMGIELAAASSIFVIWMYYVQPYDVWRVDVGNTIIFASVAFFIHIIANSIRIKEFVLSRRLSVQKDTDDLTGLKNKGALTRGINEYLADKSHDKGTLFVLDIDRFKSINDTFGHDVGDDVIRQLGTLLGETFPNGEIVGRFGGDEFIVFIPDAGDRASAENSAKSIVGKAAECVRLPDPETPFSISIGIALYHGQEQNYSELFKKADIALYDVKARRKSQEVRTPADEVEIYREPNPET